MADPNLQQDIFNVPNKISAARLLLSFVFFALLPLQLYWAALVVFVICLLYTSPSPRDRG